jgi:hypothetical protein
MKKLFDISREFFKPPSTLTLASIELEAAKRELLVAQTGADYALNICKYNQDRITRLTVFLRTQIGEQA